MDKKVSILIATHNSEKYIKKTLQSCLDQTYSNFEILVREDASKDSTAGVVKSFNDSRIKLFEDDKNIGPYAGLNYLIDRAEGKYIAIQDHDDIWFPEKIEKQVEFLEKNKDFVACGTNTFYLYEFEKVLFLNKKQKITNFVDHMSLMFRNDGFRYDTNYLLADEYFEKKILSKNGKIFCLQDSLAIHRIKSDGTNLSSSRFKLTLKNLKDFFEINNFCFENFSYFLYLIISRHVPDRLLWFIRKNITRRDAGWISLQEFESKYPQIEL